MSTSLTSLLTLVWTPGLLVRLYVMHMIVFAACEHTLRFVLLPMSATVDNASSAPGGRASSTARAVPPGGDSDDSSRTLSPHLLVHVVTKFPALHLPLVPVIFISFPGAFAFWISPIPQAAVLMPAVLAMLLTIGGLGLLGLAQNNAAVASSSWFLCGKRALVRIMSCFGRCTFRTRTVALLSEETQAWFRELPAMWRIIIFNIAALQIYIPFETFYQLLRAVQVAQEASSSDSGLFAGELFWSSQQHAAVRALQANAFTQIFYQLELTSNGLILLSLAPMVTLMTSCLAWDATFFTLAMAQQNKQQQQSTAMLRWLSHECRSPVSAALLTVEYLLSEVMPACREQVLRLQEQGYANSIPSNSLQEHMNARSSHRRNNSLASASREVTLEHSPRGDSKARPGQQVGLLAGTLALSRASGSKSFEAGTFLFGENTAPHAHTRARSQSSDEFAQPPTGGGGGVAGHGFASSDSTVTGSASKSTSIPGEDKRSAGRSPTSPVPQTSTAGPGRGRREAVPSGGKGGGVKHENTHPSVGIPETRSFDVDAADNPVALLDEVQQYIEMMAQPMTALSGVLDNMLLYMKKQHAAHDEHSTGAVKPFSLHNHGKLGVIGVGSLLESAWQNATASQDVMSGGGLRENAVGLATSVGTVGVDSSAGSVSTRSSAQQPVRLPMSARHPGGGAATAGGAAPDPHPLRMTSPLCSMPPSQGLLFLQGMAFRSKVTQSTCLQVVTNYLTNALKYGRSEDEAGHDTSNILLEITLLQFSPLPVEGSIAALPPAAVPGRGSVSHAPAPWLDAVMQAQLQRHHTSASVPMRRIGPLTTSGVSEGSTAWQAAAESPVDSKAHVLPRATVRTTPGPLATSMLDDSSSTMKPKRLPSDEARSHSYRGLGGGQDEHPDRELSLAVSDSLQGAHIVTFRAAPAGALKKPGGTTPLSGPRSPVAASRTRPQADRTSSSTAGGGTLAEVPSLAEGPTPTNASRVLSSMQWTSTVSGSPRRPSNAGGSMSDLSTSLGVLPSRLQPFAGCLDSIMQGFTRLQEQQVQPTASSPKAQRAGATAPGGRPPRPGARPSMPSVSAPPLELQHGVLVLSVTDHGRGLTSEECESLFQPFARLRSGSSAKGNGLGLWLMKELIESQGGSLAVHSAGPGHGSTFAAFVPVQYEVKTAASAWEMHMQQVQGEGGIRQGHNEAQAVALAELEAPVATATTSISHEMQAASGSHSRSSSSEHGKGGAGGGSLLKLSGVSRRGPVSGLEPLPGDTQGSVKAGSNPPSGKRRDSSVHSSGRTPARIHEDAGSPSLASILPTSLAGAAQPISLGVHARGDTADFGEPHGFTSDEEATPAMYGSGQESPDAEGGDSEDLSPRLEASAGGNTTSFFQFNAIRRVSNRSGGKPSRRGSGSVAVTGLVPLPVSRASTDGARSESAARSATEGKQPSRRKLARLQDRQSRSNVQAILRTLSAEAPPGGGQSTPASPVGAAIASAEHRVATRHGGRVHMVPPGAQVTPGDSTSRSGTSRVSEERSSRRRSSTRSQPRHHTLSPETGASYLDDSVAAHESSGAAADAEAQAGPHGFSGSVMVVDDAPTNRTLLARQVKRSGYVVHTAVDGQDGLKVFSSQHGNGRGVGLVITDMTMPHLNGDGMVREMVSMCAQRGWHVPIFVVVSGNVLEDDQEAMRTAGAHVVLSKPARLADILQRAQEVAATRLDK